MLGRFCDKNFVSCGEDDVCISPRVLLPPLLTDIPQRIYIWDTRKGLLRFLRLVEAYFSIYSLVKSFSSKIRHRDVDAGSNGSLDARDYKRFAKEHICSNP